MHDLLQVAMYHDQGHIPAKLVDFDRTVNVTLGLPIIRTSVDHGTAFGTLLLGTISTCSYKTTIDSIFFGKFYQYLSFSEVHL